MRHRLYPAIGVLALAILLGTNAWAHPLDPILLEIRENEDLIEFSLRYPLATRPGMPRIGVKLPAHCEHLPIVDERHSAGSVSRRWRANCGGQSLAGETVTLEGLSDRENDAMIRVALADGRIVQAVVRPGNPSFVISERASPAGVLRDYAVLGFEHILSGLDHLLFVFGLLLIVRGGRALIGTITAFTLGHSITLSLAVLDAIVFPQRSIEVLIAASLVVLALEVLRNGRGHPSWLGRRPWLLASGFGLLHGLGFASALEAIGLPEGEIPRALFSFNLGIEAGQLVFVGAVLVLRAALMGLPRAHTLATARWIPGYIMGSLAFFWLLERAAPIFGR